MRRTILSHILLSTLLLLLFACGTSNPNAPVIFSITPLGGAAGTRVTIDGNSFTINPGRALLSGVSAEIVSWTNNRVVAVVPTNARTGNWIIDNGTFTGTSTQTFDTGVSAPLPTATPTPSATATPLPTSSPSPTASPSSSASPGVITVTTLAGNDTAGSADGTGTAAQLNSPTGIIDNGQGTLFIADSGNNKIRMITSSGVVTSFAGNGTAGFADGVGTAAQFNFPMGLVLDSSGNIVVADRANHRIRLLTASGAIVTSTAGNGTSGFADGTGTGAQFNTPTDSAVDPAGNIYVADSGNNRIRLITTGGVVTTLAGSATAGTADGTGATAQFSQPVGLVFSSTANLIYVADTFNHRIRAINGSGVVTTLAGGSQGFADGSGTAAQFSFPSGLTVDTQGNLYVADTSNNRIRKVTPAGVVTTIAGSGSAAFGDGAGSSASFNQPAAVDFAGSGSLFVVDTGNNRIRSITGF